MVLGLITLSALIALFLLPPIPQSQDYHAFADGRALLGVPNLLNVISNLPFVIVGVMGLGVVMRAEEWKRMEPAIRIPFVVLFIGVALTGLGSAYYHLAPTDERLVWDRLPMTVVFMSFFAVIIAERMSARLGLLLLAPLVVLGIGSVLYWDMTGDLRPYVLVQFYPMLAIPLIALLFPARLTRGRDLLGIIGWYAVAKIVELLDGAIFSLGELLSGHTLKHLFAAAATYAILRLARCLPRR